MKKKDLVFYVGVFLVSIILILLAIILVSGADCITKGVNYNINHWTSPHCMWPFEDAYPECKVVQHYDNVTGEPTHKDFYNCV